MTLLVTGGAGYIGSHIVVELLQAGHHVLVVDNLCNSSKDVIHQIEKVSGRSLSFVCADIRDRGSIDEIFLRYDITSVFHLAGLKAVSDSFEKPLKYYDNNVRGTLVLCQAMEAAGVRRIIFSSSATVYGNSAPVPYKEYYPRGLTCNPYGASKAMVEKMLEDLWVADERWSIIILRYFNPIGAHPSGLIGENPKGTPNNIMPCITQVAVGHRDVLTIFGNDYETRDGTCERDYVHVSDLASGHVGALKRMNETGVFIYNLGSSRAYSVLELINAFSGVTGVKVPYKFGKRRPGDLPAVWADASKAYKELGWRAEKTLDDMILDVWRWQSNSSYYNDK